MKLTQQFVYFNLFRLFFNSKAIWINRGIVFAFVILSGFNSSNAAVNFNDCIPEIAPIGTQTNSCPSSFYDLSELSITVGPAGMTTLSELAGTYDYVTTKVWCNTDSINLTGQTTIEALGGGVYSFNDWSFGGYNSCYGSGEVNSLTFTEVCQQVSFTKVLDQLGQTYTFDSSIDSTDWTISWINSYGESGTTIISNPAGWSIILGDGGGELQTTFHSAAPASAMDMSNQLASNFISADQTVYVMVVNARTGDFDVESFMVDITLCDEDMDGVPDDQDQCPGKDDKLDSDGDGTPDCLEQDLSDIPFSINEGKALDFDGINDYVDFPSVMIGEISGDYTIELWFKLEEYPSSGASLFDMGHDWNIRQYLGISENDFRYTISIWNGTGVTASEIISDALPSLNEWHHVAITYNDLSKIGTMYLDGQEVGAETLLVKPADFLQFGGFTKNYIGRSLDFDDNRFFKGQIDEFRYWSTHRSAEEIADNRFCRQDDMMDLLIYTPFEDGIAEGDNTGLTTVTNYSNRFAQFFGNAYDDGFLQSFALIGNTSNYISATEIPPCAKCEIGITNFVTVGSCPNAADGSIQVEATCPGCNQGEADLEYSIDEVNFQANSIFENVVPGDYTVTIRGSNNSECLSSQTVTVAEVDSLPTVMVQNLTLVVDENRMATIDVSEVNDGSFDDCSVTENLTLTLSQTSFDCDDLIGSTPCVEVTTIAGVAGPSGFLDTIGTEALFFLPWDVVKDSEGNLFVTDRFNSVIRKITPDGTVSTFAGTVRVRGLVDSTGLNAQFNRPRGIVIDASDNLYVADEVNNAIRKITPEGVVTTLADLGNNGSFGLDRDSMGNFYVASGRIVLKVTPEGVITTLAGNPEMAGTADGNGVNALFLRANDVAVDKAGNVFVVDFNAHSIRKITPEGDVTTIAGMANERGASDGTGTDAGFASPTGIAIDDNGIIYITDQSNQALRRVTPGGTVTTMAGNGVFGSQDGTGAEASFSGTIGIGIDNEGSIYITESQNIIRKLTPIDNCLSTRLTVTDEAGQSAFRLVNVNVNCEVISSVNDRLVSRSLSLSPNPISTNFNLEFTLLESQHLDIFLNNALGQRAHQFFVNRQFLEGTHQLNLNVPADLPKGMYFLSIVDEGIPVTIPLVKQ